MSTEQTKAVVRRFIKDVLVGGNLDLIDDLLAPNYVNRGMGGMGGAGFEALLPVGSAGPDRPMEIEASSPRTMRSSPGSLSRFTLPSGEKISGRGLTYYRLADGKIVEDDPITTPDLTQVFADQMPAPAS